jgi:hypothetical protein
MSTSPSLNMLTGFFIVCADISPDGDGIQEVLGRGKRSRNTSRMDELIQAEGEDSEGDRPIRLRRTKRKVKDKPSTSDDRNFISSLSVEDVSDANDNNFAEESHSESGSETGSTGSDNDIEGITNEEVRHLS